MTGNQAIVIISYGRSQSIKLISRFYKSTGQIYSQFLQKDPRCPEKVYSWFMVTFSWSCTKFSTVFIVAINVRMLPDIRALLSCKQTPLSHPSTAVRFYAVNKRTPSLEVASLLRVLVGGVGSNPNPHRGVTVLSVTSAASS